jgi:hypothetical protein
LAQFDGRTCNAEWGHERRPGHQGHFAGNAIREFVELARIEEGDGADYLPIPHAKIPSKYCGRVVGPRRGSGVKHHDHRVAVHVDSNRPVSHAFARLASNFVLDGIQR